jgi:hypothetical protein
MKARRDRQTNRHHMTYVEADMQTAKHTEDRQTYKQTEKADSQKTDGKKER